MFEAEKLERFRAVLVGVNMFRQGKPVQQRNAL
jgi:hypothetical protein